MMRGREQGFVQKFIAQPPVEAFDEGILGRLSPSRGLQANRCRAAGRNVVPVKLAIIHELQDWFRGELCSVVADYHAKDAAGFK